MISFAWPWAAILLPLPFVMQYMFKRQTKGQIVANIHFPRLEQLRSAFGGQTQFANTKLSWQQVLLSIAWVLIVVSIMRPEVIEDTAFAENSGYDLLLAVDLSRSMDTIDFLANGRPISRIAATKKVVGNFVKQREGDRLGLIVFADNAYMTVPLTLDTVSVGKMLDNLLVGMAGDSTALGDAIGIGVNVLRHRPRASRVLILLTDGQDNASHIPPIMAAKIAKKDHIKIYTIGVGNQLDTELLTEIAEMTGGKYSLVTNVDDLTAVYNEIDQLEKSDAKQRVILIKRPIYYIFTSLSLICCFIVLSGIVIRIRKRETYEPT